MFSLLLCHQQLSSEDEFIPSTVGRAVVVGGDGIHLSHAYFTVSYCYNKTCVLYKISKFSNSHVNAEIIVSTTKSKNSNTNISNRIKLSVKS